MPLRMSPEAARYRLVCEPWQAEAAAEVAKWADDRPDIARTARRAGVLEHRGVHWMVHRTAGGVLVVRELEVAP